MKSAAILAGIDVKTSIGLKHLNLSERNQINILAYRGELLSEVVLLILIPVLILHLVFNLRDADIIS
jgi:hypothetical protein